jgi:Flp pilus assembly pilin Flp
MSTFMLRGLVAAQNRLAVRNEDGQATAEYGTVMLIAVALGMAVLALVTGNKFDGVLHTMIEKVLKVATGWIS